MTAAVTHCFFVNWLLVLSFKSTLEQHPRTLMVFQFENLLSFLLYFLGFSFL